MFDAFKKHGLGQGGKGEFDLLVTNQLKNCIQSVCCDHQLYLSLILVHWFLLIVFSSAISVCYFSLSLSLYNSLRSPCAPLYCFPCLSEGLLAYFSSLEHFVGLQCFIGSVVVRLQGIPCSTFSLSLSFCCSLDLEYYSLLRTFCMAVQSFLHCFL